MATISKDTVAVGIVRADENAIYPNIDAQWGPWSSTDEYLAWVRGPEMMNNSSYVPSSGQKICVTQTDGTVREMMWQKPADEEGYWELGSLVVGDISGAVYFNSIAALKSSTELKAGDIAITKGYYSANDGGGSTFSIISSSEYADKIWKQVISGDTTPYVDDATLIKLANGLYANIVVPANMEVSFLQMGARKMSLRSKSILSNKHYYISQPDNKPYMMKWLAFNDRRKTTYNLFVPAGVYSFSETWLLRTSSDACCLGIRIRGECMQNSAAGTIFIPHYRAQKYIIRIGYRTNDVGYTGKLKGVLMRATKLNDIVFGTKEGAWTGAGFNFQGMLFSSTTAHFENVNDDFDVLTSDNEYRYVTKAALWLDSCPYSQFDGLYFACVAGTCMYLTQCFESHFGYINIRGCGRVSSSGYAYPAVYINAPGPSDVSACYFYYFNIEGCSGNVFYSQNNNFAHNEFNNIQIEGSVTEHSGNTPISKLSSVQPYDTDPDYTTPSVGSGEVFGRWVKLFVFTGNMGTSPNYVNSISATNFGNGYKRYRTYRKDGDKLYDMYGNVVTDGYVLENEKYYAVDGNNNKIVDFYRFYALFGQDENDPRNIALPDSNTFGAFVWNIGVVYLFREGTLKKYSGPWVVYLRNNAQGHQLVVNQLFSRLKYPYYFSGIRKGMLAKESCNIPGAIPFVDLLDDTNAAQNMVYTREGACSPNGLCIMYKAKFSFVAAPNVKYYLRGYCRQSVYDTLLSHYSSGGYPLFKWQYLLCIGDDTTPYTGTESVVITKARDWITIPLPDLRLTEFKMIYFNTPSGTGNSHSRNFLSGLYLDVLICGQ